MPLTDAEIEALGYPRNNQQAMLSLLYEGFFAAPENHFFAAFGRQNASEDTWGCLIDLDGSEYPHESGAQFLKLGAVFLSATRDNQGAGAVQMGVITRIDAASADVALVQGVGVSKSLARDPLRDRIFHPYHLSLKVEGGKLSEAASSFQITETPELNTGMTIPDAFRNDIIPSVGDAVCRARVDDGSFDFSVSCFYCAGS